MDNLKQAMNLAQGLLTLMPYQWKIVAKEDRVIVYVDKQYDDHRFIMDGGLSTLTSFKWDREEDWEASVRYIFNLE